MQLGFSAPQQVLDIIASIGRTEDLRFAPDGRRFAVAAMPRQRICLFDIDVRMTAAGKQIHLSAASELSAPQLRSPHGLDFLDSETLAVANRDGGLSLFRLPLHGAPSNELVLLQDFASEGDRLQCPSSVAALAHGAEQYELLVCRAGASRLSRHLVDGAKGYAIGAEQLLLDSWLASPNGISSSRHWLALSSLDTQSVLLYRHGQLPTASLPQAVLRGASAPHGLRFSADERHLLLADAGSPYVHIYFQPDGLWQGVYDPSLSLRVMDDPLFQLRNATPPLKGGPKGLDVDWANGILATTCQTQSLAFFDLDQALTALQRQGSLALLDGSASSPQPALDVRHELDRQQLHAQHAASARASHHQVAQARHQVAEAEARARHAQNLLADAQARATHAESRVQALLASHSWRMTAPLRWLLARDRRQS